MDWKSLLAPTPSPVSAGSVDRRIAEARGRFRLRVATVGRLGPDARRPAFGAGIAAAVRRWLAPPVGDLERLERHVEDAQRQVSRMAAEIDALAAEEAGVRDEMASLRDWVTGIAESQASVEDLAARLRAAILAVDVARSRATPTEGAALDADLAVLAGRLRACEADIRALEHAAVRGTAVIALGSDALALCGRLRDDLEGVHRKGTSLLHALDASLGPMAAQAGAGDLGRILAAGIEPLRGSVGRVHMHAQEGADQLIHRLDALIETPDLLAPADPARRAAEAEVARIGTKSRD